MPKGKEKTYSTSDLPLVAVLRMRKDVKMEKVEKEGEYRLVFHFTPTEKAEEVAQRFYNQELKVEPFEYFQTIRSLKSLIYSELK